MNDTWVQLMLVGITRPVGRVIFSSIPPEEALGDAASQSLPQCLHAGRSRSPFPGAVDPT